MILSRISRIFHEISHHSHEEFRPIRSAILSVWPSIVPYTMRIFDMVMFGTDVKIAHFISSVSKSVTTSVLGHVILKSGFVLMVSELFPYLDTRSCNGAVISHGSVTEPQKYIFPSIARPESNSPISSVFTISQNGQSQVRQHYLTLLSYAGYNSRKWKRCRLVEPLLSRSGERSNASLQFTFMLGNGLLLHRRTGVRIDCP